MKNPLTPSQKINKLKSQIRALNKLLTEGKIKNVIPVERKIKGLKEALNIEVENHYWEALSSI